jgi:hypothetical protein
MGIFKLQFMVTYFAKFIKLAHYTHLSLLLIIHKYIPTGGYIKGFAIC